MTRTTIAAGVLAVGGLLAATCPAHAGGCCGGGGGGYYRGGGYGVGHTFGRSYSTAEYGGTCCNMGGMSMAGMAMSGASMQGMNMGGVVAPAPSPAAPATTAAASQYYCPMHPNVVSAGPAICPYCQMALKRR
jgi:hypothetical protein